MNHALRTSTAIAVLVILSLLVMGFPAHTAAASFIPDTAMQNTALPTEEYQLPIITPTTISQPPYPAVDVPLVDPSLSLYTGPVSVPLSMQIPALNIDAPVLGVGLTLTNAMAAPIGFFPDDPIWRSVFWYRGGGIPGEAGTATFAGHYDDAHGLPAVFAFLGEILIGDLIIVRDERTGREISYLVTETQTYTDEEAADPEILSRIFGSSASSETEVQPVSDQRSHLTLITCTGAWIDGSFDLRLVVYATEASFPLSSGE